MCASRNWWRTVLVNAAHGNWQYDFQPRGRGSRHSAKVVPISRLMSRINGSEDPRQLRANRLVVPNFQIAVWRAPAAHLRDADGRSHVEAGPSLGWADRK